MPHHANVHIVVLKGSSIGYISPKNDQLFFVLSNIILHAVLTVVLEEEFSVIGGSSSPFSLQ